MNTPTMQQERRLHVRKTLNPLPHISLPSDNGGLVLDVSEQGLRFRAFAPVDQSGPIQFSFSAHSHLIAGVADLVWTDSAKKTGGLRFTELSDEARESIREWPSESNVRFSIGEDLTLQIAASNDSSSLGATILRAFGKARRLGNLWLERFGSTLRDSLYPALKDRVEEWEPLLSKNRFQGRRRTAFNVTAVAIAVIVISMLSYARRRQAGESLVWLGTKISGEGHPQTIAQTSASNLTAQASGAGNAPTDKSTLGGSQEQSAPQPANAAEAVASKINGSGLPAPEGPAANGRHRTPAVRGSELLVQVAALKREADARTMADNLRRQNFQAFVQTLPIDAYYRVMIGPYADMGSALTTVEKLKRAGVDSFVRRDSGAELSGFLRIANP